MTSGASGMGDEEKNSNMKLLLVLISKHGVDLLVGFLKQRLFTQCCAPSSRNYHLFLSRSGGVACRYIPCLSNCVVEGRLFLTTDQD